MFDSLFMRLLGIAFASFSSGTYLPNNCVVLSHLPYRLGRVDLPSIIYNIYSAFRRRLLHWVHMLCLHIATSTDSLLQIFRLWNRRSWPRRRLPVVGGPRPGRPSRSGNVVDPATYHPSHILLPPSTVLGFLILNSAAGVRRPPEPPSGCGASLYPSRSIRGPSWRGRRCPLVRAQTGCAPLRCGQMETRQATPSKVHAAIVSVFLTLITNGC